MSQPTLNEKAAALIEELTVMADLHGGNGDTVAAEEFSEWVDVVRDLVAELDCPHRLARHSKRLIEQQRTEIEALRKRIDDMSPLKGAPLTGAITKCLACGGHHFGLGNLPCPKMTPVAQALSFENRQMVPAPPVLAEPHPLIAAMSKGEQP